jgi:YVTN family beta-propeller protein
MEYSFIALVRNSRMLVAAVCIAVALPALAQKTFSVQDKWKVGGEGDWDYLVADSAAHRLYVTHQSRIEVIDTSSGKFIGAVTGIKDSHSVALDDAGKYGYISDGRANAVIVFDRQSLQAVTSLPTGNEPDGIVFEPVSKTVWAFNSRSKNATVIDTTTQKVIATVALQGKPESPVADGTGSIFNNIKDKSLIVRINAQSRRITATWPLSPCESPSGLAIDRTGRRLFAVCNDNKMAVVDANTGKVIATPTIGSQPDAAAYDPKTMLAFSSNGDGTLTVIDTSNNSYKVLQNLATERGARTMALDSTMGKIYLSVAKSSSYTRGSGVSMKPGSETLGDSKSDASDNFSVIVVGLKFVFHSGNKQDCHPQYRLAQ